MKRLCFLMAALLLMTACGKKEVPPMTLANPISASSLEALEEESGHPTAAFDDLEMLSVRRYNVEPVLYELEFTGEDGLRYTLRLTEGVERTDISGMYFNWTQVTEEGGCSLSLDDEGHGICLWCANGFAYSLAMEAEASVDALRAMQALLAG